VTDPLSSDCDRGLGTLAAGASKSYTCTRQSVTKAFENIATATGKPPTGSPVKSTDHADVTVSAPFKPPTAPPSHPKIHIVKSPKLQHLTTRVTHEDNGGSMTTKVAYATAKFTIKVTNTGNTKLSSVRVTDPLSPGCDRSIGRLAIGSSSSYTCQRTDVSSNFTNIATVTGKSPAGVKVKDSDHATVRVSVKTTGSSPAKFAG
jgi:hypothetical protein